MSKRKQGGETRDSASVNCRGGGGRRRRFFLSSRKAVIPRKKSALTLIAAIPFVQQSNPTFLRFCVWSFFLWGNEWCKQLKKQ